MKKFWSDLGGKVSPLRGLATIGIVDISGNIISGVFWMFMARILGAEQYGQISYFLAIAVIGSAVSLVGSENTLMVYTAKNVKIQPTFYIISLSASIISASTLYFLFFNTGASLLVIGYVIFGLVISEILGRRLYNLYSKYVILQKILTVILVAGFYYAIGIDGVILGMALSYFPYLIRIYREFKKAKIDFSLIKTRLGFIINSYVLSLAGVAIRSSDKLIVGSIFGYTVLGNYQVGLQVVEILQLLPAALYKYTLPHDASGNSNKKLKKLSIYFAIGFVALTVILSPIILPELFPKFTDVIQIVQISSFALIPNAIASIYASKFLGNEKSKIVLVGLLIYFATQIVLIFTLGRMFGINGVAMSFVLSGTAQAVYLVCMNKIVRID